MRIIIDGGIKLHDVVKGLCNVRKGTLSITLFRSGKESLDGDGKQWCLKKNEV